MNDLVVGCGCSYEKLPMIVTNVLTLMFGILPSSVMQELVKCTKTYQRAAERSLAVFKREGTERFTSLEFPDSPVVVCLCMDESNKGNKALVAKPYVTRSMDGDISLKSLTTDISMSKKANIAQEQTLESILAEVGTRGASKINAATVDGFGVASAVLLMSKIDDIRCGEMAGQREVLVHSSTIQGLTYDYSKGPVGRQRIRVCMMHVFECEMKVLIESLLKQQGLKHDASPSQNMYTLSHIMEKMRDEFLTLGVISVNGDVSNLDACPKDVLNLLKKAVESRWMSRERGGEKTSKLMNVPASEALIAYTAEYYGGTASAEWGEICKWCTCLNDDTKLSHILLCCLYLTNHSPNARKGEGFLNCSRLVACWSSPFQRISIVICGEIYKEHIKWAKFADGVSGTHKNAKVISTRMIEQATFERSQMFYLEALDRNWKQVLPLSAAFVLKEATRAVYLGVCENEQVVIDRVDALMKIGESKIHFNVL